MADITKVNAAPAMVEGVPHIGFGVAGEVLAAADAVYLKTADGRYWKTDGTAADEKAEFVGLVGYVAAAGEPITIYQYGSIFKYGASMTPGNYLYLSVNPGLLADAPSTGDPSGVAQVLNGNRIQVRMGVKSLSSGTVVCELLDGGAAGDHIIAAIAVGDTLIKVLHISTKASIATMADLTGEFTVAAGKITNAAGTDTTNDQLLVFYNDLT